jgi:hypothetical protein
VLQQGENSVLSDVSLTSSKKSGRLIEMRERVVTDVPKQGPVSHAHP